MDQRWGGTRGRKERLQSKDDDLIRRAKSGLGKARRGEDQRDEVKGGGGVGGSWIEEGQDLG